MSNNKI